MVPKTICTILIELNNNTDSLNCSKMHYNTSFNLELLSLALILVNMKML